MPTQVPQMAAAIAARVAGVAADDVDVHVTLLGGGFGRRLEVDYVAQAVRVAMDCGGAPVQLIWSREEDTAHDFYRPMHVARLRATLDAAGPVTAACASSRPATPSSPRWMERGIPALAGAGRPARQDHRRRPVRPALRLRAASAWSTWPPAWACRWASGARSAIRTTPSSPKASSTSWPVQAGQDPVEFRRELLERAPRYLAVLDLAAQKAGWGSAAACGPRARRRPARIVRLHRRAGGRGVAGQRPAARAPGGVRHRLRHGGQPGHRGPADGELRGVRADGRAARADRHPRGRGAAGELPRLPDGREWRTTPLVETWIVPSERPPGGVGEPGVPPLAPAVANALFALTGERLRSCRWRCDSLTLRMLRPCLRNPQKSVL